MPSGKRADPTPGLRIHTTDEFTEEFCDGKVPTGWQLKILRNFLSEQARWPRGHGAGRTTLRRWMLRYIVWRDYQENRFQWRNFILLERDMRDQELVCWYDVSQEPFCVTHQCGADEERKCGKEGCPHCFPPEEEEANADS